MTIRNGWKKVKKILQGGKERYHSSLSAIESYAGTECNLIFHDAVRPLVSQRIINDVVTALDTYQAIDVALPSADTIIEVEGDFICQIPDRSRLRRGQTPQAFDLETIRKAYEIALKDPAGIRSGNNPESLRNRIERPELQGDGRLRCCPEILA